MSKQQIEEEIIPEDDADDWLNEKVFLGLVLELKARDVTRIKELLQQQAGVKLCHAKTSMVYLRIEKEGKVNGA